jgi:hypothetical protein
MTHPLIAPKLPIIRQELNQDRSVLVHQPMAYGPAWELCKLGAKICRWGWRERGMFIYCYKFPINPEEGEPQLGPIVILCVNAEYHQPGWAPSTGDLFAEDWYLYPIKEV